MGLGLALRRRRRSALRAHRLADEAAIARARGARHGEACATCSTRSRRSSARSAGSVPLIGFAGSPFTLACYMIEGGGSADFAAVRRMAVRAARPAASRLVDVNARAVAAYLNEQIARGRRRGDDLRHLGRAALRRRVPRRSRWPRCARVLAALRPAPDGRRVPTIVFTKGGGQWLESIAAIRRVGGRPRLDRRHRRRARARVGARVALQGNLDPLVLLTDPETVAREAAAIVRAAGPAPGHIFNLGHGIVPGDAAGERRRARRGRASRIARAAPRLDRARSPAENGRKPAPGLACGA